MEFDSDSRSTHLVSSAFLSSRNQIPFLNAGRFCAGLKVSQLPSNVFESRDGLPCHLFGGRSLYNCFTALRPAIYRESLGLLESAKTLRPRTILDSALLTIHLQIA